MEVEVEVEMELELERHSSHALSRTIITGYFSITLQNDVLWCTSIWTLWKDQWSMNSNTIIIENVVITIMHEYFKSEV